MLPPSNLKETHRPNATKIAIDMASNHSLDEVIDTLKTNGILQVYKVPYQKVSSINKLHFDDLSPSETKNLQ